MTIRKTVERLEAGETGQAIDAQIAGYMLNEAWIALNILLSSTGDDDERLGR